jgi:hypothetical protein
VAGLKSIHVEISQDRISAGKMPNLTNKKSLLAIPEGLSYF